MSEIDNYQVTEIYLPWDTKESLPTPPPLQRWAEVSPYGSPMRRFILVPREPGEGRL